MYTIDNNYSSNSLQGLGFQPAGRNTSSVPILANIISTIIGFLTIVAFIYFLIQLIFAGYSLISAQGDEKKVESGRKRLTDGILGITIVVVAYGFTAFLAKLLGLGNIFNLTEVFNNIIK
jgi:hypothetical protein